MIYMIFGQLRIVTLNLYCGSLIHMYFYTIEKYYKKNTGAGNGSTLLETHVIGEDCECESTLAKHTQQIIFHTMYTIFSGP